MKTSLVYLPGFALVGALIFGVNLNAEEVATPTQESTTDIAVSDVDVGVVYSESTNTVEVGVRNNHEHSVEVDRVVATNGAATSASHVGVSIPPNAPASISFQFEVGNRTGKFAVSYDVYLVGKEGPSARFIIRGFADWVVDPTSLNVDLGVVPFDKSPTKNVTPSIRPGISLKFRNVEIPSRLVDVGIDPSGNSLSVTAKNSKEWGIFDESVTIRTNSDLQPRAVLRVRGELRGPVVPSTAIVNFGLVREGQPSEQAVRIVDQSGKKIHIGSIRFVGTTISTSTEECMPAEIGCKLLRLRAASEKTGSAIQGRIFIELPDYSSVLSLVASGLAVGKDEVISNLNDELAKSGEQNPPIGSLLKSSVAKPAEMEVPEGNGPLLTWHVTGNEGIFGFEIYRSTDQQGPFQRVSAQFISPISIDPKVGAIYRWRDNAAQKAKKYWYYVGIVFRDGRKQALTDAQMVIAK